MAIAHDASSTGDGTGTSLTAAHTISGTDRLLLVSIGSYRSVGGTAPSSVTYSGVAMTQIYDGLFGTGDKERHIIYALLAPATGTNNIVGTWALSQSDMAFASDSYTGIDQTTGWGTPVANVTDDATSFAVTVTDGATGDLVWATAANYGLAPTLGTGLTARAWNSNGGAADSLYNSDKAGAASVTATYTWAGAESASLVGVNLFAASSAVNATVTPAAIAATMTIPSVSVAASVARAPDAVAATMTIPTPTVSAVSADDSALLALFAMMVGQ